MTTDTKPYWVVKAKKAMKEKGLTQHDLLDVFDVTTRGAVGHYFRGRQSINVDQLDALSKRLGVRLDYAPQESVSVREALSVNELSNLLDKWLFKFHQLKLAKYNADIEQLKGLIIADVLEDLGVKETSEEYKEYVEIGR